MAKRRASGVDSDAEEPTVESSPASKRARFQDDEDGDTGKRKPADREDDEDVEVEEDDEEKKFEEKYKERIQASIHSGTKHQGVCVFISIPTSRSHVPLFRVWPSAELFSPWKCTSLCVTRDFLFNSARRLILSLVTTEVSSYIGRHFPPCLM